MKDKSAPSISIIIRTLNEAKYLPECLDKVKHQLYAGYVEVIIVDSGSIDETVEIAKDFGAKIVHITKSEFTFGRSLNLGCKVSSGELLVFLSAHCIPCNSSWLSDLVSPLIDRRSVYSYGRQIPREGISKFSEGMVYKKYYPPTSSIPQTGYFCNNANAAILRTTWSKHGFNEKLTGLEDIELAMRLVSSDDTVSYVASSVVEHIHEECWSRIKIRYEREAVALANIEPNLSLSLVEALRLFVFAVGHDLAFLNSKTLTHVTEIIKYRACQYYGSFVGSRISKNRLQMMRQEYFYPKSRDNIVKLKASNHSKSSDKS